MHGLWKFWDQESNPHDWSCCSDKTGIFNPLRDKRIPGQLFLKGPDSKYFRFCCSDSALPSSWLPGDNGQPGVVVFNKTLFITTCLRAIFADLGSRLWNWTCRGDLEQLRREEGGSPQRRMSKPKGSVFRKGELKLVTRRPVGSSEATLDPVTEKGRDLGPWCGERKTSFEPRGRGRETMTEWGWVSKSKFKGFCRGHHHKRGPVNSQESWQN